VIEVPLFSGLLDDGELYHRFDEIVHEGMRLGRNQWLDARSLAYMIENNIREMGRRIEDKDWERPLTILDQGELGSCTGNAGTGALGTQPFYEAIGRDLLPAPDDAEGAEEFAVQLYSDATRVDSNRGEYPPTDTGSSGMGICKVLRAGGVIKGYRWARSPYGLLQLLQNGPVLQGMPWYNAFFTPDDDGFIDADPRWYASGVAGGHEVEAVGLELDADDAYNSAIIYANSWGPQWGVDGRFKMRLRTYEHMSGVDLKQFVV
jgi:Papain family cysteine protease